MNKFSILKEDKSTSVKDSGIHELIIYSISETQSNPSNLWDDTRPMLLITFKSPSKSDSLKMWIKLERYKVKEDYSPNDLNEKKFKTTPNGKNYEVDNNNNRVVCNDKTQKSIKLLGQIASHAGLPIGEEISFDKLIGRTIMAKVADGLITHFLNK